MDRLRLLACCALLVCLAGFGGNSKPGAPADLSVQVELDFPPPGENSQTFTLKCDPASGTLPFAALVCEDVEAHPGPMLNPRQVGPPAVCTGDGDVIVARIVATADGKTTHLGGDGFLCGPITVGAAIYEAAALKRDDVIARDKPLLRCDDDPGLVANPTRLSIQACMNRLWTPSSERAIKLAEGAKGLAPLDPTLFPRDIGARPCAIALPSSEKRRLNGQCGVLVNNSGSSTIVTFIEYWGPDQLTQPGASDSQGNLVIMNLQPADPTMRHNWRVVIKNNRVASVSQSGAVPPQF